MHIKLTAFFAASTIAMFASSSWAANPAIDFSTIAVAGGIDGYAIMVDGATKLKGSPFVPSGLPTGHPDPNIMPSYIITSPTRDVVFAVYLSQCTSGARDSVAEVKLTKAGFTQQSLVQLVSGGNSCSGGIYSRGFGATTNYFFYEDSFSGFPFNWNLYYTKGGMTPVGEIEGSNGIESYVLQENENAVYACRAPFGTSIGAPYTQVDVYTLSSTSLSFGFSSTDSEFIASKCGTVTN